MAVLNSPPTPVPNALAAARLLREQAAELPQKDELCGPFWGLVALRAAGVREGPDGQPLDQDAVAAVAGSRLSPPPRSRSRPPGEPSRDDYRLTLPIDPDDPGTTAAGVAHGVADLSAGRLAVVPVTGEWHARRLLTLLGSLSDPSVSPIAVIANLHTSRLWPSTATAADCSRYLESGRHDGPRSDWSIGHFVALVGVRPGARGTVIEVADTYRSRGVQGRHRQPVERIAAALGGHHGARGLLVVVPAGSAQRVRELAADAGLQACAWDGPSSTAGARAITRSY